MCKKHDLIFGLFFETFLDILQIFWKILKKKKKNNKWKKKWQNYQDHSALIRR